MLIPLAVLAAANIAAAAPSNQQVAFEFFVGKGLKNFQAAGIVGNLAMESGVNPNSGQAGGSGQGIAQWLAGGRWNNVVFYAAQGRHRGR